ncbi:uncharacterized protein NECHADRAFT_81254 [Fusarium vanettenii 77-13-4]|uniref:Uncharacterized protein n=1 Tax=Fusarium vanettenii (strain ATCC MYA-4622 / CBS 123669 / FGSC 9596 / NRRL 45880 / 77-13-4) TaxID=660122 RepID=C7ZHI3_FUSV7|nr:uncharacterized protein NECHADRAFT_81254 [Fusarium vanettenii 77-13-4]EEU36548.1 predicted protein [Fusarium vanettenii 77-13-4]
MPMHGWHVKSRNGERLTASRLIPTNANAARPGLALGAMRWRPPWRCRPAGMSPGIDPFSPPLPTPFQGVEADERALIPLMPECLTKEPVSNLPQAASLGRRSYTLAEARRSLQTLLRTVRRIHFKLPAFDDGYYSAVLNSPAKQIDEVQAARQTRDRFIQFMHELILSSWL